MRATILLALAGLAACGDKGDNRVDDTGGGAGDGGAEVTTPTEGHWSSTSEVASDSCGFTGDTGDTGGGEGGFTLTMTDDTHFTVQLDEPDEDGWDTMSCTLSGSDFTCEQHGDENPVDGFDATIVATQDVSGTFPTWSTMEGQVVVAVDCTGADCATVIKYAQIDLPCEVDMTITAQADE